MTESEANDLFREYRGTKDIGIRKRLIENYMEWADSFARRVAFRYNAGKSDTGDIYGVAMEELSRCVDRYDPDRKDDGPSDFRAYASKSITGVIKNYFRDEASVIRPPRNLYNARKSINEFRDTYFSANGCNPNVSEIAEGLGMTVELVSEALEYTSVQSLDSVMSAGEEGDAYTLHDLLQVDDDDFERSENIETVRSALRELDDRQREIIRLRYYENLSQAETGRRLGMNQMAVSRAEAGILEILRRKIV